LLKSHDKSGAFRALKIAPGSRCLPLSFAVELTVVFVGGLATF
jgi:hypothetical protein